MTTQTLIIIIPLILLPLAFAAGWAAHRVRALNAACRDARPDRIAWSGEVATAEPRVVEQRVTFWTDGREVTQAEFAEKVEGR